MRALFAFLGVLGATASATHVQVWHFPAGTVLTAFAVNPDTGDLIQVSGETSPGDLIRQNADGSFFASFSLRGEALLDVQAIPGGPEFVGDGLYIFAGSVVPRDPADPLAGVDFGPDGFVLHIDCTLADPAGALWRLTAQVLTRDGEITHFDLDFVPLG